MLSDEHVTNIRANQAFHRNVLHKHGYSISSRWRKASQAKRASALHGALPDIQVEKWEIFEHSYGPSRLVEEELLRKTFLLPYIS